MDIVTPPAVKTIDPATPSAPVVPVVPPAPTPASPELDVNALINAAVAGQIEALAAKSAPPPAPTPAPVAPDPAVPVGYSAEAVKGMIDQAVKTAGAQFEARFIANQRPPMPPAPAPGASTVYGAPTIVKKYADPAPLFWAVKALTNLSNNRAMLKFDLGKGNGDLEFDGTEDAVKAFKAMATTAGGAVGEHFVPQVQTNLVVEALYQKSIVRSLKGIVIYPMATNNAAMPTIGTFSAAWSAENAAATAAGDAVTGQKTLNAKKLTSLATLSNEILVDSNPGVEPYVRKGMGGAIGEAFDLGGFAGDGVGVNPLGLLNEPGVVSTAAGADDLYTAVIKAIGRMAANKIDPTDLVVIMRPEVAIKALITREGASGGFLAQQAGMGGALIPNGSLTARITAMLGYDAYLTTALPAVGNASPILVLKASEWVLGDRQELDIQASNVAGSAFANDQTLIRGILRADFQLMRAAALEVVSGFPH